MIAAASASAFGFAATAATSSLHISRRCVAVVGPIAAKRAVGNGTGGPPFLSLSFPFFLSFFLHDLDDDDEEAVSLEMEDGDVGEAGVEGGYVGDVGVSVDEAKFDGSVKCSRR